MATATRSRASKNGTASSKEKARRTRQSATAKARKPDANPLDVEWQKILEHEAQINAEYNQLLQQRQTIDAEIDRVQKLANQLVGRKDLIMEMKGEKEPLPTVAELMKQRAEHSGIPAAAGAEEPGEAE